ncbi:MAG: hypothetical protein GXO83_03485 [Chlorobi bacterium]|nr:hypothetical protein [Chlorobiota bacterium]
MIQDILTYIALGSATVFIGLKLFRTFNSGMIRKESGCSSCSCHTSSQDKRKPLITGSFHTNKK